jgi:ribonucleoside-diphosphate reductase alpha subunit
MFQINFQFVKIFLEKFIFKFSYTEININILTESIVKGLPSEVDEKEFYTFVADKCVIHTSEDPEYNKLGGNIITEYLHLNTEFSFKIVSQLLYNNTDQNLNPAPLLSSSYYNLTQMYGDTLQKEILDVDDYKFDYFGIKTLERSYLMKIFSYENNSKKSIQSKIVERPSHMFMRVALFIHQHDIDACIETYHLFINKYFTHATPTLFNAGTPYPQLSSCYLISIDDSIDSIGETMSDIMKISKWAGGIGIHTSSIRADGSIIRKTNGQSNGTIPFYKGLNWISTYVNQGGKRKGVIAVYKELYHADIIDFLELRKNTGSEERRCRDLFLALWISDLFMERCENDEEWSLMCPDQCKGLNLVYGIEFKSLYEKYEKHGMFRRKIKARELFKLILISQCETGFPYMCYKDHANIKSNQKNLGTIRSSNLCSEIMEYSDSNETAVCNLVSICLPKFVVIKNNIPIFDYDKFMKVCRVAVRNLNKVIDLNFYPTEKTAKSNLTHRPIGIGVQGLADVYNLMRYPFESTDAMNLNKKIFEYMYFACVSESNNLAKIYGPYESFKGSPFSEGILQWGMWKIKRSELSMELDWDTLILDVQTFGTRNSLLTALMPTASTSQIMGNSECFEPLHKMLFVRTTLAGEFIVLNENLIRDLKRLGIWSDDIRKLIIISDGSIQRIDMIPADIKTLYKTAFEISLQNIIQQSIDRGPFIDQSQSLNLFMSKPDFTLLTSAHFYGWKGGLKTGMYYLHSSPAVNPINFGIDIEDIKRLKNISSLEDIMGYSKRKISEISEIEENSIKICKYIPGRKAEGCDMCSS